jgi:hypothetical protein
MKSAAPVAETSEENVPTTAPEQAFFMLTTPAGVLSLVLSSGGILLDVSVSYPIRQGLLTVLPDNSGWTPFAASTRE